MAASRESTTPSIRSSISPSGRSAVHHIPGRNRRGLKQFEAPSGACRCSAGPRGCVQVPAGRWNTSASADVCERSSSRVYLRVPVMQDGPSPAALKTTSNTPSLPPNSIETKVSFCNASELR